MATKRSKTTALVVDDKVGYIEASAVRDPVNGDFWNIEIEGQRFYVWQNDEHGTLHQAIELLKAVAKEIKKEGN